MTGKNELRHVYAKVAHTLEMRVCMHDRPDETEVGGDRSLEGQEAHDPGFGRDVDIVDAVVFGNDLGGDINVTPFESIENTVELSSHQSALGHETALGSLQFLVKIDPDLAFRFHRTLHSSLSGSHLVP
jgi:hypothetical protein